MKALMHSRSILKSHKTDGNYWLGKTEKIRDVIQFNLKKNSGFCLSDLANNITALLNSKDEIINYPIHAQCEICGYEGEFCCSKIVVPEADFVSFNEVFHCRACDLNSRERACLDIALQVISNTCNKVIFIQERVTPYFDAFEKLILNNRIIGSEFLGNQFKSGTVVNGIRHDDAMAISFESASVDYIISNHVLEHVPDFHKAFAEIYRVLKTDALLIFTIPFHFNKEETVKRAVFENGILTHLLPPVYHGNPIDPESGSLCFNDFGWDIFTIVKKMGFIDCYAIPTWNEKNAHINYDPVMTLIAVK